MFLRGITDAVSEDVSEAMETTMKDWIQRKRGRPPNETGGMSSSVDVDVAIPLGQGEWDEPLGLPLCVVCHKVCGITILKKTLIPTLMRF